MRRLLLIFLVAGFPSCAPYPPETPETAATESISEADLRKHLEAITAEATQGRATASPGYAAAGDYVVAQLATVGALPGWPLESGGKVWRQPVPLDRLDYGPGTVLRLQRGSDILEARHGVEMIIMNPGRGHLSASGTPVFVGFGVEYEAADWNDYAGLPLDGALGLIITERPDSARSGRDQLSSADWNRLGGMFERLENMVDKGVAAILAIPSQRELLGWSPTADRNLRMPLFPTRCYTEDQPPLLSVPLILLSEPVVEWLFAGSGTDPLEAAGLVKPEVLKNVSARLVVDAAKTRTACFNIIGTVAGSDESVAEEVVVVSAHLDHLGIGSQGVFKGANDDAAGCAAIIEVMEAIAMRPLRRTVMAVLTTGEEIGHFGSLHFVANLPVERDHLAAAVTLEHLGRIEDRSDGLEIVAERDLLERLKAGRPWLEDLPVLWGDIEQNRSGKVWGSDTQSFRMAGIPVVLLGGGGFPEYHTPEDTADRIDLAHLRFTTRITYAVVEELANAN